MSRYPDIESFRSHLETLGLNSTLLQKTIPDPTLSMGRAPTMKAGERPSRLHTLPELSVHPVDAVGTDADLHLLDTLGEGGMGLVQLANQVALDRRVAVKTTRSDMGEDATQALLQEAYVTGYLEHPNIIPIYMVGRDDDGAPLIVMKRVEGASWLEMLPNNRPLDWSRHVKILIQVANAVRFAHSRRIVHRDIKPDNVMIGDFDEVYLLDWGVATALEDHRPLLPTLDAGPSPVGTPAYMAPEMAEPAPERIDERTDVYLLGATLHHVLTGQPRHNCDTVLQTLFSAYHSEPVDYPDHVPDELADIANTACRRDSDDRFQSAEAFRDALSDFLEHRQSIRLADSANDRLDELQSLLEQPEPTPAKLHDTYGECRFGFDQALRIWPDNPRARRGLQSCLETMADHHLDQRNVEAARTCIADLPEPTPRLNQRVEQLGRELQQEQQELKRLQRLEQNLDVTTSAAQRSLVALVLGIIWTATSLWAAVRIDQGLISADQEMDNHAFSGIRNLGIAAVATVLFRKQLMANSVNRRLVYIFFTMLATVAFLRWATLYLSGDIVLARTADTAVYVITLISIGLIADARICLIALIFVAAAVVGVIWPDIQLYANSAAAFGCFGALAWIWAPRRIKRFLLP